MTILGRLARARVPIDRDGQPPTAINWRRVEDRQVDELLGLCKGFIADGVVDINEARFLLDWLERNRHCTERWPANVIYPRLHRMLADGVLDDAEEHELLALLLKVSGGGPVPVEEVQSMSSTLPLSDPPPMITFEDRVFCATGKFVAGPRSWVQKQIEVRGGSCAGAPTRKTNYLVIGLLGSRDWAHSSFGRKIEQAVTLRESGKGVGISIVSEERWAEFL